MFYSDHKKIKKPDRDCVDTNYGLYLPLWHIVVHQDLTKYEVLYRLKNTSTTKINYTNSTKSPALCLKSSRGN